MIANNSTQQSLPLEEPPADGRTYINASLWFVDQDGYRVVFRWHEPLYRVALTDTVHVRQVAVSLRQSELATQAEIAKAFGHSEVTQRRWERRYEEHGLEGLRAKSHPGRPRQLSKGQEAFVRKWFKAGVSNLEMARRLGVGETTIRRTLDRLGLKRQAPVVSRLPGMEEETSPPAIAAPQASDTEDGELVVGPQQKNEQDDARVKSIGKLFGPQLIARPVVDDRPGPERSQWGSSVGPDGSTGRRGAAFRRRGAVAASRSVVGRAVVSFPRGAGGFPESVRILGSGVLWSANDGGDVVSLCFVADQAAGGVEGTLPS